MTSSPFTALKRRLVRYSSHRAAIGGQGSSGFCGESEPVTSNSSTLSGSPPTVTQITYLPGFWGAVRFMGLGEPESRYTSPNVAALRELRSASATITTRLAPGRDE